jgi:hypothetical protein
LYSSISTLIILRRANLSNDAEIAQLKALYDEFSESFVGPTVRSEARWKSWVRHAIGASLWVAEVFDDDPIHPDGRRSSVVLLSP